MGGKSSGIIKTINVFNGRCFVKKKYFTKNTRGNVDKDNRAKFAALAKHVNGLSVPKRCWGDVWRQNDSLGQNVFNLGRLHGGTFSTKTHYGLYYDPRNIIYPGSWDYELNSPKDQVDAWEVYNLIKNFPNNKAL